MTEMSILAIITVIAGSSSVAAVITHWLDRRKHSAEASTINVQSALLIEERAVMRYHSAAEALDAAQAALDAAREQIRFLECQVLAMHDILTAAGLKYELPLGLRELVND